MNPYDFVPVDWSHPPQRRKPAVHDRFAGLSGSLEATVTAERPLFVKRGDSDRFFTCNGKPAIPGTSLKGMFRSLVEATTQGCFRLCRVPRHASLPNDFQPCSRLDRLCPACRLFGMIKGNTLWRGAAGFDDAECTCALKHDAIYTAILSSPKSDHQAFYRADRHIAGRKFYFHHQEDNLLTASGWLPHNAPAGRRQNQRLSDPLGPNSTFRFRCRFENVAEDDLAALLYAVTLDEEMRHQIGYAKPCGLGSIRVEATRLELRTCADRYRRRSGPAMYEGASLSAELARRTAPFAASIPAVVQTNLRRIWTWPPHPVTYRYPTRQQFDEHPEDPISSTDSW